MCRHLWFFTQIRAFLQLGTQNGKESIAIAVDVCALLMTQKGISTQLTVGELRDNIPVGCGVRLQSHVFRKLDSDLRPLGSQSIKVPVVHATVFPKTLFTKLAKCKCNWCFR